MEIYREMYTALFNAVSESLGCLAEGDAAAARWVLEEAQRSTENMFMEWDWENSGGKEAPPS